MFTAIYAPGDEHPAGTEWTETLADGVDYRAAYRAVLAHAREATVVLDSRHTDAGQRQILADGGFNGAYLITRADPLHA